jgi:hypothetical protein
MIRIQNKDLNINHYNMGVPNIEQEQIWIFKCYENQIHKEAPHLPQFLLIALIIT